MGLKTVTIQGRLTRDPKTRTTQTGTNITSFTVAVDSNRPPRDGNKQPSSFFRVSTFGKRAQSCQQYLSKGDEVTVVGDIELDVYQGDDGQTYANMQVNANDIFFGRKGKGAGVNGDAGGNGDNIQMNGPSNQQTYNAGAQRAAQVQNTHYDADDFLPH